MNEKVDRESDLLFFGHFSKFRKEEYIKGMKELVSNEERLQEKIIGSIYSQGKVLNSKYRNPKIAPYFNFGGYFRPAFYNHRTRKINSLPRPISPKAFDVSTNSNIKRLFRVEKFKPILTMYS
jgi:hypothetical protein